MNAFVRHAVCLLFVFLSAGCMQLKMLPHLDQAMTLQALSKDGDAQHKFVVETDRNFDAFQEAMRSGAIKKYKTSTQITKAFGLPITAKVVEKDGKLLHRWLYRYALQKTGPQKIYIYFNADGQLMDWEYIDPQPRHDQPSS